MQVTDIQTNHEISPARIMEIGTGFWVSKTLLAAIKLELFTYLGSECRHAEEIRAGLGLDQRSIYDFLDALVALGLLKREGLGQSAYYENTAETAAFLDKNRPDYIGGVLEMANDRVYPFWSRLEDALRTGRPQNEIRDRDAPLFDTLYADPERLKQFTAAMASSQIGNFKALCQVFPFKKYHTLCDIGGANAMLSVLIAQTHPHLHITTVDMPAVEPVAHETVRNFGLTDKIQVISLDMMRDTFPRADLITMGNILHDWNLEQKKLLIRKAYEALPEKGALIVIENIIDDDRRENVFGLMMSLHMLIETEGGFDYSHAEFHQWAVEAGFMSTSKIALTGPASAVVAYK